MKRNLLASLLALCAIAGQAQKSKKSSPAPLDSIVIEGVFTNIPDGTHLQIARYETQDVIVKDGKFRIVLLPQQKEEIYCLYHKQSIRRFYAEAGKPIKITGDGTHSAMTWLIESDNFEQKENNAYDQFIKENIPDYYELKDKLHLTAFETYYDISSQKEYAKANQEIQAIQIKLYALKTEKYTVAMIDFMMDRPFSKRMIRELYSLLEDDKSPAIIEKAREIFKKYPQEVMNQSEVKKTKGYLTVKVKDKAKVGEQMKDFTLFDREGNKHQLSEFKGKTTILIFTSTTCGGCLFIKPFFDLLYKRNKDKAEIISIYVDTEENWKKAGQENKVSYHEWHSQECSAEPKTAYGIVATPSYVIIDPNGKILEISPGTEDFYRDTFFKYIPDEEMKKVLMDAIDKALHS